MTIDRSIEWKFGRLRIWNIAVGLVLAVQAIMIAVLTNSFSLNGYLCVGLKHFHFIMDGDEVGNFACGNTNYGV